MRNIFKYITCFIVVVASSCVDKKHTNNIMVSFEEIAPTNPSFCIIFNHILQYDDSLHNLTPNEMVYYISYSCSDSDTLVRISPNVYFPEQVGQTIYGFTYNDVFFRVDGYTKGDTNMFIPTNHQRTIMIQQNTDYPCMIDDSWNTWEYSYNKGEFTLQWYFLNGVYEERHTKNEGIQTITLPPFTATSR